MSVLHGKKVLLFTAKFFGYETEICKELERQGAIVKFYDERNNPSSIDKILLRKCHFLMNKKVNRYYKKIVELEKSFNPDYILFISPEALNKSSIEYMRHVFEKSIFILYMWDSMKNINAKRVYKYFDRCLSFDPEDCKNYDLIFRPLFFINSFEKESKDNMCKYDFSFIGSVHSDRARILNRLRKIFFEKQLSFYYYIYVPSKLMLFVRSLLDRDLRELRKFKCVYTIPITKEEVAKIADESNYIIDINHPKQIGLTMRTIEMLGSHKKLLTTNTYIKNYDFYELSNQIVFSRDDNNFCLPKLIQGYNSISEKVYNKYRLSEWVKDVFLTEA